MSRLDWGPIIERAAEIVRSYDTSVTLRQLFYRLVSEQLLANTQTNYKALSSRTSAGQLAGTFPELIDRTRRIERSPWWTGPRDALSAVCDQYRLDRTTGQDTSLYIGVEKAGLVVQLRSWFGELGIPVLPLGGYTSAPFILTVQRDTTQQARPAVLIYAGDYDPSGEDIDRDFIARSGCWSKVIRVALSAGQVSAYRLPPNPGKVTDSRAAGFVARHGELVQVELDALPPETLRELFTTALGEFWDESAYQDVLHQERGDLGELDAVARQLDGGR